MNISNIVEVIAHPVPPSERLPVNKHTKRSNFVDWDSFHSTTDFSMKNKNLLNSKLQTLEKEVETQ